MIEKFATKNVKDVFTGKCHSFLIAEKNKKPVLKAWGKNVNGQLGLEHTEFTWFPTEVDFFNRMENTILAIEGGDNHTLVLMSNNDVYCWGKNDEGQVGIIEDENSSSKDVHLTDGAQPLDMSGNNNALIDNSNNHVNTNAEVEENKEDVQPVLNNLNNIEKSHDTIERKKDYLNENTILKPMKLNVADVSNIFSSNNFNYCINRRDNKVYSWGFGESYVLGNKKDEGEQVPFSVPKEFFKSRIVDQVNNT